MIRMRFGSRMLALGLWTGLLLPQMLAAQSITSESLPPPGVAGGLTPGRAASTAAAALPGAASVEPRLGVPVTAGLPNAVTNPVPRAVPGGLGANGLGASEIGAGMVPGTEAGRPSGPTGGSGSTLLGRSMPGAPVAGAGSAGAIVSPAQPGVAPYHAETSAVPAPARLKSAMPAARHVKPSGKVASGKAIPGHVAAGKVRSGKNLVAKARKSALPKAAPVTTPAISG